MAELNFGDYSNEMQKMFISNVTPETLPSHGLFDENFDFVGASDSINDILSSPLMDEGFDSFITSSANTTSDLQLPNYLPINQDFTGNFASSDNLMNEMLPANMTMDEGYLSAAASSANTTSEMQLPTNMPMQHFTEDLEPSFGHRDASELRSMSTYRQATVDLSMYNAVDPKLIQETSQADENLIESVIPNFTDDDLEKYFDSGEGFNLLNENSKLPEEYLDDEMQSPLIQMPLPMVEMPSLVTEVQKPIVEKRRGPGRPRKNNGKTPAVVKRKFKKGRSIGKTAPSFLIAETDLRNTKSEKVKELITYKSLGSAGTTPATSVGSISPSGEHPNQMDDYMSASGSLARVYAEKPSVPIYYSSQRKRKLKQDDLDDCPITKKNKKKAVEVQPPVDHLYSTYQLANHPKRKNDNEISTKAKKQKVLIANKKVQKKPDLPDKLSTLNHVFLVKDEKDVISRPSYHLLVGDPPQSKQDTKQKPKKARRRNFFKPAIHKWFNKKKAWFKRRSIQLMIEKGLSKNKVIQRRMARFSLLPGVTCDGVNNAYRNWVNMQIRPSEYYNSIRVQKVSAQAHNKKIGRIEMEDILKHNGVVVADPPKMSDRLGLINESEIIHEVKQRYSANQAFILLFIEKFNIVSPMLAGYVLRNVHPKYISESLREIILKCEIAPPPKPINRACKANSKPAVDSQTYRDSERSRLRHNAMERKRRLEQKMSFEIVRLTCPELYSKKSSIHEILRGLKNTVSMTSTYFHEKIVVNLHKIGFGVIELEKLKKYVKVVEKVFDGKSSS